VSKKVRMAPRLPTKERRAENGPEGDQNRDRNFNDADQIRHRLHAEHVVKPKHKWAVRHQRLNPSRVCIFSSLSQKDSVDIPSFRGYTEGFQPASQTLASADLGE